MNTELSQIHLGYKDNSSRLLCFAIVFKNAQLNKEQVQKMLDIIPAGYRFNILYYVKNNERGSFFVAKMTVDSAIEFCKKFSSASIYESWIPSDEIYAIKNNLNN